MLTCKSRVQCLANQNIQKMNIAITYLKLKRIPKTTVGRKHVFIRHCQIRLPTIKCLKKLFKKTRIITRFNQHNHSSMGLRDTLIFATDPNLFKYCGPSYM